MTHSTQFCNFSIFELETIYFFFFKKTAPKNNFSSWHSIQNKLLWSEERLCKWDLLQKTNDSGYFIALTSAPYYRKFSVTNLNFVIDPSKRIEKINGRNSTYHI